MADETSPPLRLADTAVDQMNLVIRNADQLDAIVQATMKATPALSGATVAQAVSKATNIDTDALNPIFNALDNLDTLREQLGSTEEALDSVLRAFGKEKFPGFDEARPKIIAAVNAFNSDNPVSISIKARRLSRLYEKLFIEAEIITDARPVYNSDVSEVLEYVVGQCLVLTYHEDSGISGSHGHPRLHMAMDTDDIIALRDACDRAIKKGITIKADLGKKARMLGDDG